MKVLMIIVAVIALAGCSSYEYVPQGDYRVLAESQKYLEACNTPAVTCTDEDKLMAIGISLEASERIVTTGRATIEQMVDIKNQRRQYDEILKQRGLN